VIFLIIIILTRRKQNLIYSARQETIEGIRIRGQKRKDRRNEWILI